MNRFVERSMMMVRNSRKSTSEKQQYQRVTRHLTWDNEGVASTVGTIMALMIFLTFLSMFTNQYVPVWMEDNESAHMNVVESQFALLKQGMDIQILAGLLGEFDVILYHPITLGAQGVPMFASPTLGQFMVDPDETSSRTAVTFLYDSGTTGVPPRGIWSNSSGSMKVFVANRYYVVQTLIYENDAIILMQKEGQLVKSSPQLILRYLGKNATGTPRYDMVYSQISMIGSNQSYTGFDTRGVQTLLRYASKTTYEDAVYNETNDLIDGIKDNNYIYINQTTKYGDAWTGYFNNSLTNFGLIKDTNFFLSRSWVDQTKGIEMITLRITSNVISSFTINNAYFDVFVSDMGVGG